MSAQDLEQRAREILAAEYERDGKAGSADHIRTQPLLPNKARAVRAIAAALRQQPAPVDLEQFREAVEHYRAFDAKAHRWAPPEQVAEADRLLSIIDNAGKVEVLARGWFHPLPDGDYDIHDEASGAGKDCDGCIPCLIVAQDAAHQPAPVVDDAMAGLFQTAREMVEAVRAIPESELLALDSDPHTPSALSVAADDLEAALARAQGVQS